ncbi:MAG TPA: CAP domain-containing protein [Candidatus Limnocylindrales bacterium]|nr:CAP domain-containing protein [Candidatus Limnocylindrales bacterium]
MSRRSPLLLTLAALAALAGATVGARPAAAADYTAFHQDYAGEEATRIINGERAIHGLRALATDRVLAAKARDGGIACPNDGSKVAAGRARDIAASGVFTHGLRLCGVRSDGSYRYTVIDAMYAWGYNTYRGEILAWNTYPTSATLYHYGCRLDGTGCSATRTTWTTASAAAAMSGWMRSSGHRSLVLGNYDRVGCGAWQSPGGVRYYSCLFSLGGPDRRDLTNPTVSLVTGKGATVSGVVTFAATFGDNYRLSDGWVQLDGRNVRGFAFDVDVRSYRAAVSIDTRRLANGTHRLAWRVRDVGARASAVSSGVVDFTVRNP